MTLILSPIVLAPLLSFNTSQLFPPLQFTSVSNSSDLHLLSACCSLSLLCIQQQTGRIELVIAESRHIPFHNSVLCFLPLHQLPRGFRQYPVVVLIEGELFVTSAPSRFPGQDLAAVDMIVVSFNYRTNAFGEGRLWQQLCIMSKPYTVLLPLVEDR